MPGHITPCPSLKSMASKGTLQLQMPHSQNSTAQTRSPLPWQLPDPPRSPCGNKQRARCVGCKTSAPERAPRLRLPSCLSCRPPLITHPPTHAGRSASFKFVITRCCPPPAAQPRCWRPCCSWQPCCTRQVRACGALGGDVPCCSSTRLRAVHMHLQPGPEQPRLHSLCAVPLPQHPSSLALRHMMLASDSAPTGAGGLQLIHAQQYALCVAHN